MKVCSEGRVCNKCRESKPVSAFPLNRTRREGIGYTCKVCHVIHYRTDKVKAARERAKYRKSRLARGTANRALQRGEIDRAGCETCGEAEQMHHDDYDQPLVVRWLCRQHHADWHRLNGRGANAGYAPA